MEAGGGRRDRALHPGVNGLVADPVVGAGRVMDVGRQRQLALLGERAAEIAARDPHDPLALGAGLDHFDLERPVRCLEPLTLPNPLRGSCQHPPRGALRRHGRRSHEQDLDPATGGGPQKLQPGRAHASLVEREGVARPQPESDRGDARVVQRAGSALDHEQAGILAPGRGMLRDQLGRQGIVEVVESQASGHGADAPRRNLLDGRAQAACPARPLRAAEARTALRTRAAPRPPRPGPGSRGGCRRAASPPGLGRCA